MNRAEGDAARFTALFEQYRKAPEVTRKRLYLETLGRVLAKTPKKVVVDDDLKGIVPLLDLQKLGAGNGGGGR